MQVYVITTNIFKWAGDDKLLRKKWITHFLNHHPELNETKSSDGLGTNKCSHTREYYISIQLVRDGIMDPTVGLYRLLSIARCDRGCLVFTNIY